MQIRQILKKAWLKMLTGVASVALTVPTLPAQELVFNRPRIAPPAMECPTPQPPAVVLPPQTVDPKTTPPEQLPQTAPPTTDVAFDSPSAGAGFSNLTSLPSNGYIDNARPFTNLRLRYDAGFDNNRPDRAEFFYPKCGCFRIAGIDPNAKGPPPTELVAARRVDFQELHAYMEYAPNNRMSAFINVPYRWLNPNAFDNFDGFSDIDVGFKYAFLSSMNEYLTFQFRTYIPTGVGERGLGTEHVSLEPAILYWRQIDCRWAVFGEFRDWIPVGGSDFAGNVLRYGVGTSYTFNVGSRLQVAPVAEVVGWTVLDGFYLAAESLTVEDATGDTIINGKFGFRFNWGANSFYVGYGRALTGEVWYKDMLRLEYRFAF